MFIGPAATVGSWLASQITQSGSANQASSTSATSAATTPGVTGPSASALEALSQVGIQAQNGSQALQSFMQNLFSTLQAQGASASTPNDAGTSSVGSVAGHKGSHGHGHMEQEVQGLIQDLNSGTTSSGSTGVSLASLQQSFQSLVATSGAAGSSPTLGGFLAAFQQDLPSLGRVGNILNTQA